MRVLQINVRATQGGAGRVALDLHRRLRQSDIDSKFLYGYASGIKDDPVIAGDSTIERIGTRPSVLFNYGCHRLFGWDTWTGNQKRLREAIASTDIVHLHAVHHHFLCWEDLLNFLYDLKKPTIATAHDWWAITGRCGFTEECQEWKRGCGRCGPMRFKDPKSLFDFSRTLRLRKMKLIRRMGTKFHFICPAEHLAADYRMAFPDVDIKVIPNWIDSEFEQCLQKMTDVPKTPCGVVFSAADLSSDVKIDRLLVEELARRRRVPVTLVGRNNPFRYAHFDVRGEVQQRREMVDILRSHRALVFCSRTDISPLTLIEALSAGCFVLAYSSAASKEILSKVGGSCIPDRETMLKVISTNDFESLYGGIDCIELARRAESAFCAQGRVASYVAAYREALS